MQQMGVALPSHPFWRHEPESAGVINFVKRQGRSPAFLGPSAYETTARTPTHTHLFQQLLHVELGGGHLGAKHTLLNG